MHSYMYCVRAHKLFPTCARLRQSQRDHRGLNNTINVQCSYCDYVGHKNCAAISPERCISKAIDNLVVLRRTVAHACQLVVRVAPTRTFADECTLLWQRKRCLVKYVKICTSEHQEVRGGYGGFCSTFPLHYALALSSARRRVRSSSGAAAWAGAATWGVGSSAASGIAFDISRPCSSATCIMRASTSS